MKKVTEVIGVNDTYTICKDSQGRFWSINSKDIKNGKLIKNYNDAFGLISDTVEECIERTLRKIAFDHIKRQHPEFTLVDVAVEYMKQSRGI